MKNNIVKIIISCFLSIILVAGTVFAGPNITGMNQLAANCSSLVNVSGADGKIYKTYTGPGTMFIANDGRICFCFNDNGQTVWVTNGDVVINGQTYSFTNQYGYPKGSYNGYSANSWVNDGSGWKYYRNGSPVINDWAQDGGYWYYLGRDGYMVTGWQTISYNGREVYFYFNRDGSMVANTVIDGYRIASDGASNKPVSIGNYGPASSYYGPSSCYNGSYGPVNSHINYSGQKVYCSNCGKKTGGTTKCEICGNIKENYCPSGHDINKHKYCKFCGKKTSSTAANYCSRCERGLDEDDPDNTFFCGQCGARLVKNMSRSDWEDYWDDWYDRMSEWWCR